MRRLITLATLLLASFVSAALADDMVFIQGGGFLMGSADPMFADAQPVHPVRVKSFWIDATEVTNAQFERFVAATGYRTIAERPLDPRDYPGVPASQLVPGSAVFSDPGRAVNLDAPLQWWRYVPGANWRHPEGRGSSIVDRMDHPVVHIAYDDALAYAAWAGKRLPTEAEWEYAARGGLEGKEFVWGDEFRLRGRFFANTFQGRFPDANTAADGYRATAPGRSFARNGYGLYGVAGNVWEWVSDWYRPDYYADLARRSPLSIDPRGPAAGFDQRIRACRSACRKAARFCAAMTTARAIGPALAARASRPAARTTSAFDSSASRDDCDDRQGDFEEDRHE